MGSKDDLWKGICSLIIAVSTCATSIIPDIRDSKHQRQYGVSWPRSTDELDNVHTTPRKSHNATPCTLPSPNGQPRWPSHETHRRPHNSRLPLPLRARRHSTHDNPHRQPKTRPQIHNLRSTLRFLHGANNNMYHASCLRQLRTERTHCYRSTDLRRSRRTLTLHHQPDLLHRPSLLHTLHHHQRYRPHRPTRRLNILRRRSIPAHPPPSTQLPHPPQTSYMPILLSWRQRTQSRKIWHWKIQIQNPNPSHHILPPHIRRRLPRRHSVRTAPQTEPSMVPRQSMVLRRELRSRDHRRRYLRLRTS